MPRRICILIVAVLSISVCRGRSEDETDLRIRVGERMLRTDALSPRSAGLGGSRAAINDGANAVNQNPAALGAQSGTEVVANASYEEIEEGDKEAWYTTVTVGGSINLNSVNRDYHPADQTGNRTLGVSATRIDGDIEYTESLTRDSNAVTVGYGTSARDGRLLGGVAVGLSSADIKDHDGTDLDYWRLLVKAGVIAHVTPEWSVGGLLGYAFGDVEDNRRTGTVDGDTHHFEARVGTSWRATDRLMLTGDFGYENLKLSEDAGRREEEDYDTFELTFGAEYEAVPDFLTVRGGAFWSHTRWMEENINNYPDSTLQEGGLSGGASVYKDNWSVEYDARVTDSGDHGHYVSFILDF